tara:strand:- start:907 stop:1296 length:390 start_codon:yes stop_codon:yes gene_type:complete
VEEVKKVESKIVRHPRVDMGVPPPVKGAETSARAGAIFDPKLFKGNCMLFKHLNEVSHSMLRAPIKNISEATLVQKIKKRSSAIDDYGINLPDEDIKRVGADSDEAEDEVTKEQERLDTIHKLNKVMST